MKPTTIRVTAATPGTCGHSINAKMSPTTIATSDASKAVSKLAGKEATSLKKLCAAKVEFHSIVLPRLLHMMRCPALDRADRPFDASRKGVIDENQHQKRHECLSGLGADKLRAERDLGERYQRHDRRSL